MTAHEVNFDGLVGPTHNYAGLSQGNLASQRHRQQTSHPRAAAMQGLEKMRLLMKLGLKQAVLPPHERPALGTLRELGFTGDDASIVAAAHRDAPDLLAACCSASAMWAANAATVSPSADTADGRLHLTPANLVSQFHRSIEPGTTHAVLRAIFADEQAFAVHQPLPAGLHVGDEGAANHTRLCCDYGGPGVEVFTYGRAAFRPSTETPQRYPARQTLEASQAVARRHRLAPDSIIFVQQEPAAIDAGVFHNDVIAVGNQHVLLCHETAFAHRPAARQQIRRALASCCDRELAMIEARERDVPLADAVNSYLFNSQLVTLPDGSMTLIHPAECDRTDSTRRFLEQVIEADNPIATRHSVNVRQSMKNGGGPACLRLRVVMTDDQLSRMKQGVLLTEELADRLAAWITKHYRERLGFDDLADPKLIDEGRAALDELSRLLDLGSIYDFQQH